MKQTRIILAALATICFFVLIGCTTTSSQKNVGQTPESLGISSQAILNFVEAVETDRPDDMHGFVLMKNGAIAAQGWWAPYDSTSRHMMFSLSKSFTSTAIGIAQEEGLLSIYDHVIQFFPEYTPENPSENLKNMRIKDLLRMSTGHDQDSWRRIQQNEMPWVQAYLALPVEHKPGTHFRYNTGATYMLSAIIQKVTGDRLLDYLTPRLFDPLGIQDPTWEQCPQDIDKGGTGLNITTGDIARFGQLLLQEGQWQGEQLVPAEWVQEATALQTSSGSNPESDWDQGYGYQFWQCVPENVYRGDGAFGQYCIVMPDQQAVLAITSGTSDMQAILKLVWQHLLPAMQADALSNDTTAFANLQQKLNSLSMSKVEGNLQSGFQAAVSGKSFRFDKNDMGLELASLYFEDGERRIEFQQNGNEMMVPIGQDDFASASINLPGMGTQKIATHGAWKSDNVFHLRTYMYETPFYDDHIFTFENDELTVELQRNVSFGPKYFKVSGKKLINNH